MSLLHPDLLAILDAVEVLSPTRVSILDETREVPESTPGGESELPPLVAALEGELYGRLYVRPTPSADSRTADRLARRDLVAALSAANTGQGTWEPGWTVRGLEADGRVAVAKDELTFWVEPTGLRARDGQAKVGEECRVWVAKELRNLVPGFYVAIGDGEGDDDDLGELREPLVRYYWHLKADAAVPWMAAATTLLNAAGIPFRLKVLGDPSSYHRADAGVLYLRRRYYRRVGDTIARIHDAVATGLRPEVPLFTERLADGLGLAEDPADGKSFGQHRCGLAARALWNAFTRGVVDRDARAAMLAETFRNEGLDPLRPHLGPDAGDNDYILRPKPKRAPRRRKVQPS